ncbi:hypothetical protein VTP01DRAFT_9474 [Rhizomucor pusillus]
MLTHSSHKACFKHSDLLTVIRNSPKEDPIKAIASDTATSEGSCALLKADVRLRTLALQLILVKGFKLYSFQLQDRKGPALLCIVTTSPIWHWVICAPAAFLGCGSRFSGSLSGIEPLFPVTRGCHCTPLSYNLAMIGQKIERVSHTRSPNYYDSPRRKVLPLRWLYLISANPEGPFTHVLALELPRLSMWFFSFKRMNFHMHGLIFETSI